MNRANLRCLGLTVGIAIALTGCNANCLDPDETATVDALAPEGGMMRAVKFRLKDGTTRTCFAQNSVVTTLNQGDAFKGKLGGSGDFDWQGER